MRHLPSSPTVRLIRWTLLALGPVLALGGMLPCFGQQIHRNSFETSRTSWTKGSADAAYEETAHDMTDQAAHEGQRSEHIQIKSQDGSHIYYYYSTANAPIVDELTMSVWVKSSNPGIQLMARVVLPKEPNPASLQDRLTTVIRGDVYRKVGSWQRLEIGRPVKLALQQQQYLQAQLARSINIQDAYVDRLVLNVYGGAGVTDVWIDELEVGPVLDMPRTKEASPPPAKDRLPPTAAPPTTAPPATSTPAPGGTTPAPAAATRFVNFNGSSLQVDGKPFFFLGVRHTDTPPAALRNAGFNTLFVPFPWDSTVLKQMVDLGFWLVPELPVTSDDTRLVSADGVGREVRGFPELESVLFWNLGNALPLELSPRLAQSAAQITAADHQHATAVDAWDGVGRYSTNVNLVSVHRWPLMTTMELTQYRDWLTLRSRLATPGTFMWTWIQTHTPDPFTQLLYGKPASAGFTDPIGPQPEQVRLLTYLAAGSGFRGLGFWSDRFLADSHQGRDRLITVAMLNQELTFLEPMLNSVINQPEWIETSDPNVKAAVLRTKKGILALPVWLGGNAQFVPGQAATAKLSFTVPQVPPTHVQCWEVTPGQVRSLKVEHGSTGGMKVTLPDFGLATAVAFFSDSALLEDFQTQCTVRKQLASQYSVQLAQEEYAKVVQIEQQLEKAGHTLPDSTLLLKDAEDRIQKANAYWNNHEFEQAYRGSQLALRPVRILMRAQWDAATQKLETPVASPWAVSFYTLPRHWEFMDQIAAAKAGDNLIPGGDFEVVPGRAVEAWSPQETTLDAVDMRAERVTEVSMATTDEKTKKSGPRKALKPKQGTQFLLLEVKPKTPPKEAPPPKVLERTFLGVVSPDVKLPPGTLVRISGWMAIPDAIQASPDGALLYDSAGGEPLAVRLSGQTEGWKHFTLFRRVPPSGKINVTLALTGLGRAAFDDIRIEPMAEPGR
jgi:hypothetical protein